MTRVVGLPLVLILGACARAQSEEREPVDFPLIAEPVDRSGGEVVTSYAEMLEPVREAVVSVSSASIVQNYRRNDPREEMLRRFFGLPDPEPDPRRQPDSEPEERRVPNGLGSGVIISADGFILTNNHVVVDNSGEAADEIIVQLDDAREFEAEVVGRDARTDIALLKIEANDLPHVPMADSNNLRVGDIVFAIGNPLGVGQTTTMGIVSATGRSNLRLLGEGGYEDFIQIDAAINRGNSGGALVDAEGRLVGINSAILSPVGANIGIGFAIPSRIARSIAEELVEYGSVKRGYLGVSIGDLDAEMAEAFDVDSTDGVLVQSVQEGMPADEAGLENGDIIISLDGQPVEDVRALRFRVASIRPGTTVPMTIIRDGEREELEVTLTSLEDGPEGDSTADDLIEGVTLAPNSSELQGSFNLDSDEGIVITSVDARSPYASVLRPGMVIVEINGDRVDSLGDVRGALRSGANRLWVSFRGSNLYVALRIP
ncbi:MAG: Do family serine endopeptidase [Opitutales bacterium]